MWVEVSEKVPFLTRKAGIIAHYSCNTYIPAWSQPPFIAYKIAQYIFTTTPFIVIAIKYWQYLVRAKIQHTITSGRMISLPPRPRTH